MEKYCKTQFWDEKQNRMLFLNHRVDELLSINPSDNGFVFGDFNIHHKDWLTSSGGTDESGKLCYNFSNFSNFSKFLKLNLQ